MRVKRRWSEGVPVPERISTRMPGFGGPPVLPDLDRRVRKKATAGCESLFRVVSPLRMQRGNGKVIGRSGFRLTDFALAFERGALFHLEADRADGTGDDGSRGKSA